MLICATATVPTVFKYKVKKCQYDMVQLKNPSEDL